MGKKPLKSWRTDSSLRKNTAAKKARRVMRQSDNPPPYKREDSDVTRSNLLKAISVLSASGSSFNAGGVNPIINNALSESVLGIDPSSEAAKRFKARHEQKLAEDAERKNKSDEEELVEIIPTEDILEDVNKEEQIKAIVATTRNSREVILGLMQSELSCSLAVDHSIAVMQHVTDQALAIDGTDLKRNIGHIFNIKFLTSVASLAGLPDKTIDTIIATYVASIFSPVPQVPLSESSDMRRLGKQRKDNNEVGLSPVAYAELLSGIKRAIQEGNGPRNSRIDNEHGIAQSRGNRGGLSNFGPARG